MNTCLRPWLHDTLCPAAMKLQAAVQATQLEWHPNKETRYVKTFPLLDIMKFSLPLLGLMCMPYMIPVQTKDGTARSSPQRAAVNRNSSRPQGTAVQRSDARPMLQPIAANDLNIEDGRGKSWPQPVQVPSHCKPNHARRTPFMQSPPNPTSANIEPQDDPIPVSDVDDEIFASIDLDQLIKPAYESAPRPTYAPPPDATSVITISQAKTNNTRPLSPSTASRIDELEKERKR